MYRLETNDWESVARQGSRTLKRLRRWGGGEGKQLRWREGRRVSVLAPASRSRPPPKSQMTCALRRGCTVCPSTRWAALLVRLHKAQMEEGVAVGLGVD